MTVQITNTTMKLTLGEIALIYINKAKKGDKQAMKELDAFDAALDQAMENVNLTSCGTVEGYPHTSDRLVQRARRLMPKSKKAYAKSFDLAKRNLADAESALATLVDRAGEEEGFSEQWMLRADVVHAETERLLATFELNKQKQLRATLEHRESQNELRQRSKNITDLWISGTQECTGQEISDLLSFAPNTRTRQLLNEYLTHQQHPL